MLVKMGFFQLKMGIQLIHVLSREGKFDEKRNLSNWITKTVKVEGLISCL